ncbi:MAG: N-acetylglucosamine kinase [Actinobacteria bacterium]|nr:N-acetylglucosamine kinase [Actinomycetota bacterium]
MSGDYIVAVDGGGSKTDAVAVTLDGIVLGRFRGPGSSPHLIGLASSVTLVDSIIGSLVRDRPPIHTGVYLSGLDLPREVDAYRDAIAGLSWGSGAVTVANDLFALVRSGTESPDAVAVVCGTGINAIGVRADGATARFLALGSISGDWGGASGIGELALWHAARDEDGRGPATSLTAAVARTLGYPSIAAISEALHVGDLDLSRLGTLSPVVFEIARAGDAIAGSLVDREAEEIAVMAATCLRRLELLDRELPVILGGGVIQGRDPRLLAGVGEHLAVLAPLATTLIVDSPPVLGAALLALESAGASVDAVTRASDALARS